jgi:hypothetical protein
MHFFETVMGKRFFEGTIPKLIEAIVNLTKELKRTNDLKEEELRERH